MNKRKSSLKKLETLSNLLEESQRIAKLGGWALDVASEELVWTNETYRIHDTSPEEFNPTVDAGLSYFLPESREIISAALNEAIKNGKNYDLELQTHTTKGRMIDVRTTCQVTQHNGKTIKLIGTFQDITERKQIENKLKKSEERLALAMKGSQDGLWDWNLLNDTIYFSPRWKSMLGYEENEIEDNFSSWERLLHPEDLESALSKVEYFINNKISKYESEFRMQHKAGHYLNILSRAFVVEGSDGKVTRFVGTHVDITERKKTEETLNYQSSHDDLTGLANRREFKRRMDQLIIDAKDNNQTHALCYIDLDQFKVVNDTCGHVAGDEMLKQLSSEMQKVVRGGDTLARLGGDEFGILLEKCSLDNASRLTNALQTKIRDYILAFEGRSFRVSASMGLVPITAETLNSTDLLKSADAACYMAKDKGRNRIHVQLGGDLDIDKRHSEMQWVNRIQDALDQNCFCLYAQSIEALNTSNGVHYELLIRMVDEQGGVVLPGVFLPAAERYDLMSKLDKWVIENAFKALSENPGFLHKLNFISINLSGQSIGDEHFLDFVIQQMHAYSIEGKNICFEITETAAISNLLKAGSFINKLSQFGCRFALDDFGSGLSSFGYLKSLPVQFLKIDGMFVKDMVDDPIDKAMVKSINDIGHVMGMQTIAEFVENNEIKNTLLEMNVNYAQGYGIHMPQPLNQLLSG
jgi:diguanylate cyclase (GGDEF)-like protein/PAS domain S-box-containing protein